MNKQLRLLRLKNFFVVAAAELNEWAIGCPDNAFVPMFSTALVFHSFVVVTSSK